MLPKLIIAVRDIKFSFAGIGIGDDEILVLEKRELVYNAMLISYEPF
jgi:hypothetical protein